MRCCNCNTKIGVSGYKTYEDSQREICEFDFEPNDEYGGVIDGNYYCVDCYEDELKAYEEYEDDEDAEYEVEYDID